MDEKIVGAVAVFVVLESDILRLFHFQRVAGVENIVFYVYARMVVGRGFGGLVFGAGADVCFRACKFAVPYGQVADRACFEPIIRVSREPNGKFRFAVFDNCLSAGLKSQVRV